MQLINERRELVKYGKKMVSSRLTTGSGGNLSILNREAGLVAVTPSGMEYADIAPRDIVVVDLAGKVVDGRLKPTSELNFHLALYTARPEITAVVHTHSVYATTVACLGLELPAVHYLVGFGGKKIPLAPYATYGTPELATHLVNTMGKEYFASLMANHGLTAIGKSIAAAFATAEELELVAQIYLTARSVGTPIMVPDDEMERVIAKFAGYGVNAQEKS